jgi:hypothetical protein
LRQSVATGHCPALGELSRVAAGQLRAVSYGRWSWAPARDRPCGASDVSDRPSAGGGPSVDAWLVLVGLLEHLDRPATIRGTELVQYGSHMAAHSHL